MQSLRRNLRPIKFKGFNWTELGEVFGIDKISDDSMWAFVIKNMMYTAAAISAGHERGEYSIAKWQLKQVRNYLKKVSECGHSYDSKVWFEIARIEDDETMIKWAATFLESAWTLKTTPR